MEVFNYDVFKLNLRTLITNYVFFIQDPLREKGSSKQIAPDRLEYFYKGLQLLEDSITSDYVVGNSLTLADISLITTIASFVEIMQYDMEK